MIRPLSRRTLLRGAGATIGLPVLEAMFPALTSAQQTTPPARIGMFYFGTGMNAPDFFPADAGRDFTYSPILRPLERFRGQMTVLSGTYLEHGGGHSGDYTFLTGAVGRRNDQPVINSISADQVAAAHVGSQTRFPSLRLSIGSGTGLGGSLTTLSWNASGIPLSAENDPFTVFNRLFRPDNAREAGQRERGFQRRGSVLDAVGEQARQLQPRISQADRQSLDQYFSSVREVEQQLQRSIEWANRPKPTPNLAGLSSFEQPYAPNSPNWRYETFARMMYDLIALAFQTDSTRVVTYVVRRELSGGIYPEFQSAHDYHALTHQTDNPRDAAELTRIDRIYMDHWAYFLGRLAGMTEAGGRSVLDRTILAFSSGMGFNHSRDRLPTAVFGGRALGVSHQGHLRMPDNTRLARLWHTMLDRAGVPVGRTFQDSRGVITEIVA